MNNQSTTASSTPVGAVDTSHASAPLSTHSQPIRLVAIDLDGTLLTSQKQVAKKTVNALRFLCESGCRVVIASARPPRSVRAIYELLRLQTWQINYNGALIWDEPAGRAVFHRPLGAASVKEMIDVARDLFEEVQITCEVMDKWHTDRFDPAHTTETGRLFPPDVICSVDDLSSQPVTKLMFLGEPPMIARLEVEMLTRFGKRVSVVQTDTDLIQIMDARVSKAVALQKVAAAYDIPREQIMAIGDAPNDVAMIQWAGVGVAMDNAYDVVKQVADWIAPSNDDHGVLAALQRFGLCG